MIPAILLPYILVIGGTILGIAAITDSITIIATIAFLTLVGLMLLSKGLESMAVGRNNKITTLFFVIGLSSLVYALFLLNPDMFSGTIPLAMSGQESISVNHQTYSLLSTVPISETPIGEMNDFFQKYFIAVLVGGFLSLVYLMKNEKKRR